MFGTAVIILSIVGAWLNAKRNRLCFVLWAICNLYWIDVNIDKGEYLQAVQWGTMLYIAVYGWFNWGKK